MNYKKLSERLAFFRRVKEADHLCRMAIVISEEVTGKFSIAWDEGVPEERVKQILQAVAEGMADVDTLYASPAPVVKSMIGVVR